MLTSFRAELDHIVGFKRMPDWADEPSLPYIRALIKEVHRWAPIGSFGEFLSPLSQEV